MTGIFDGDVLARVSPNTFSFDSLRPIDLSSGLTVNKNPLEYGARARLLVSYRQSKFDTFSVRVGVEVSQGMAVIYEIKYFGSNTSVIATREYIVPSTHHFFLPEPRQDPPLRLGPCCLHRRRPR